MRNLIPQFSLTRVGVFLPALVLFGLLAVLPARVTSLSSSARTTITVAPLADVVVTNTNDSGAGSLRNAITTASPGDNITFNIPTSDPGFSGGVYTITLTSGQLVINKSLTISGPGANVLTVSGNNASRVLNVQSATVTISGLTVANGTMTGGQSAGGILNTGSLTLKSCTVSGNTAANAAGGIFNDGANSNAALTIINSTISGNTAPSFGAGIFNNGFNGIATVNLINSTVTANQGPSFGGGLYNAGNNGVASIDITNSTIAGNTAAAGGGIYNFGNGGSGVINLRNAILSDNSSINGPAEGPDIFNHFGTISANYSLIQTTTGYTASGSNNLNGDPKLEKDGLGKPLLKNNGGPTKTILLLTTSPAINAGSNALLPADTYDLNNNSNSSETLPVDQRGPGYSRVSNTTVDMGALETNYLVAATAGTPQSTLIGSAFATQLQATVTESGIVQNGIAVTFAAPASGASGTFSGGSTTAMITTNGSGIATAPVFTANNTAGPYNVIASLGPGFPAASFSLTNLKFDQTISFGTLSDKTFGDADFSLSAMATSGLPVSFAASGQCTVSGSTVHLTAAGSCTITASQAGDSSYNPAPSVNQSFNIAKASTATGVSSSINPSAETQNVTFTATVTAAGVTPTGVVQFKIDAINFGLPVSLNGSGVATIATSSLSLGTHTVTAEYAGDSNFNASAGSLAGGQVVGSVIQFTQTSYTVNESSDFLAITVTRTGNTTAPVTVKYATSDATDVNFRCNPATAGQITGAASRKCDYHITVGRLRFAAGETSKQIILSIVNDVYVEGPEALTIALSNPTGALLGAPNLATINITDNDNSSGANPIDGTPFYVRMLYVDLLSREPDPAGFAGWVHRIDFCGQSGEPPPPCDRVTVGGDGFLRSAEFFEREFFVIRLYRVGLGRILTYNEVGDLAYVSGFLSASDLELNKQELVAEIMSRPEFSSSYNGLPNDQFVDKLIQTSAAPIPSSQRASWVNSLNSATKTRAQVYREVSERQEVSDRYLHEAQVVSCYYGFFTRNPDAAYFTFLDRLDRGEITLGDLANAFINAAEYRQRFGP